ncbi:MAG TPA: S1 RNA-binding domain-containing protein [Candidatus Bariatricus faecipullorum]|nr:S1 RNA-binding domain-containing protein [Candidatus Bariatricus faecipullorum]
MENEKLQENTAAMEQETAENMADYEEHLDDANPWNIVADYMEKKTILPVKVEGIVNGGAIAMVEGIRGFIPASRLSLSYIEDLESYLLKDIEVRVIEADQASGRLILSAREILREKEQKAREELLASVKVGSVLTGTVESLQSYGAFVRLENGLSGLVHISQISTERIKTPGQVLNIGDTVSVKVIGIKDGKISLSMKALMEDKKKEEETHVELPKSESIGTSLGDLLKNL